MDLGQGSVYGPGGPVSQGVRVPGKDPEVTKTYTGKGTGGGVPLRRLRPVVGRVVAPQVSSTLYRLPPCRRRAWMLVGGTSRSVVVGKGASTDHK